MRLDNRREAYLVDQLSPNVNPLDTKKRQVTCSTGQIHTCLLYAQSIHDLPQISEHCLQTKYARESSRSHKDAVMLFYHSFTQSERFLREQGEGGGGWPESEKNVRPGQSVHHPLRSIRGLRKNRETWQESQELPMVPEPDEPEKKVRRRDDDGDMVCTVFGEDTATAHAEMEMATEMERTSQTWTWG